MELSATQVTLSTKRGVVRIPLDEVHRAKRIPDPVGLERAAALAMPAPHTEQLGEWQLRAAEGFSGRANSTLALGDPGMPFSQAVDAVLDFYRRHDLPPRMDVPLPLGRPIARRLEQLGWQQVCTVLVRVMDLPDLIAATPDGSRFALTNEPTEQMLEMIGQRRGMMPGSAGHVLTAVPRLAFAGYQENGALVSMARGTVTNRMNVTNHGGRPEAARQAMRHIHWLGLTFVETAVGARRRGLAREAVGALARWADDPAQGATRAYLQVQDDNTGALALYDSLGFAAHHQFARYTRLG